jgi:CRP/FNR family cyclic AMP-dependent transcriptional regulator
VSIFFHFSIKKPGEAMLTGNVLFADFSEQDRSNVLAHCVTRKARKKEAVIHQGASGRDMFFVVAGHLRVSALSDEGKEVSFGVLGVNDYFGELSMLDGRQRIATVAALEDCEMLMLSYAQYQNLLQQHPRSSNQLLSYLLLTMAERLRLTDGLYQDTVFLDVSARLAKFLLKLSEPMAGFESSRRMLKIELSQYELGTLINASRESVNKQLRDWESRKVIEMNSGRTILLDIDYLQQAIDN